MGVQRSERATLNVVQVKDALRRLDPVFLNEAKALSAAKAVMRGVEVMTVDRLLEELGALAEELPKAEPPANGTTDGQQRTWYEDFLRRLSAKLAALENKQALRLCFEKCDLDNSGLVDETEFRTCLAFLKLFPLSEACW